MTRIAHNKPITGPKVALAVTTALASVALAGCATQAAPRADASINKAQVALAKGQSDKAIAHAEAAVLAEPRNAGYRAMLGAAYLEAGRFQSAATSFNDAIDLGDSDPRTVLSYALAQVALGDNRAALTILDQWQEDIDPADLGLAVALAGLPDRGVHVLTNALRNGQNSPKVRQNLAYAYALQGNWRAARVMAAEDVPADQIDDRIGEWAQTARPEAFRQRVASLLQVSPVADPGQPAQLALANFPSQEAMIAEAATQLPPEPAAEEQVTQLAAIEPVEVAPSVQGRFDNAFAVAEPLAAQPAPARYVAKPVVQETPRAASGAKKPAPRIAASSSQRRMAATGDSHLVQLGSFASRGGAERAWTIYQKRYPQLSGHDRVITEAQVSGKTYYRVAAAGFGATGAQNLCSAVKASGKGCFAYAAERPLPGALDRQTRMASR